MPCQYLEGFEHSATRSSHLNEEFPGIQQITLTSICSDFREQNYATRDFLRSTDFELTSVAIGSRTYGMLSKLRVGWLELYDPDEFNDSGITQEEYNTMDSSYDFVAEIKIWSRLMESPHVHHIRLEQVELDSISPTQFHLDEFKNLRIVMLYPWSYTQGPTTGKAPLRSQFSLPEPSTAEYRLLYQIIDYALPKLRILHIGCHRTWLTRAQTEDTDPSSALEVTPVPLWLVKEDPKQRQVMEADLEQLDWDFLDSLPEKPVQDLSPEGLKQERKEGHPKWNRPHPKVIRNRS